MNVEKWCFSFHLDGASFSKSREFCNEIGGEMVVLDSKEKEEVLTDYIEGRIIFFLKENCFVDFLAYVYHNIH